MKIKSNVLIGVIWLCFQTFLGAQQQIDVTQIKNFSNIVNNIINANSNVVVYPLTNGGFSINGQGITNGSSVTTLTNGGFSINGEGITNGSSVSILTNGGVVLVAGSNITVNGSTNMVPLTNGATVIISSVGGGGGAGSLSEVLFIGNDAAGQSATNFGGLGSTGVVDLASKSGLTNSPSRLTLADQLFENLDGGTFIGRDNVTRKRELVNVGEIWVAKDSNRDWEGISISSDGKYQTAVAGGDNKIRVSLDYGQTWTAKDSSREWSSVSLSSDGKYQTAVERGGEDGGDIYVSSDYGQTWTINDDSNRHWSSVSISSDGKYQTAVGDQKRLCASSDYGQTWITKDSIVTNIAYWLTVSISSDGKYQTAAFRTLEGQGQILISSDYGQNWTAKGPTVSITIHERLTVSISSDGKYQTAVVGGGQIYISYDYGQTWAAKDSNRNWKSVSISSDGKYQTAVEYGGQIYVSYDYGQTWVAKDSNRYWNSVSISSDGKYQTAVEYDGQIYVSVADEVIRGNLIADGFYYASNPSNRIPTGLASVLTNGNDAAGQSATNFNYLHQTNQAVLFELNDNQNVGLESTGYPVTRQQYGTWAGVGALSSSSPKWYQSSAEENSAFGYMSAYSSTGMSWCTALGNWAMSYSWGWGNLAVGNYAYSEGTGQWNVVVGPSSGYGMSGSENVAIGDMAASWSTSAINVAIGYYPLAYSVADLSIGIGYEAFGSEFGTFTSVGDFGIYIGSWAGCGSTGSFNTVVGDYSFQDGGGDYNTTLGVWAGDELIGSFNTAFGGFALSAGNSEVSSGNTAIGAYTMWINSGNGNTAVGSSSLPDCEGTNNVAIGSGSASGSWGSFNVLIGSGSGNTKPYSGINNSICIGADAPSLGDNTMVLGNEQITNTFIYGNIAVTGNIIPVVGNTYDIGSSNMPFRHGYFGSNSVYLGQYRLGINANGSLTYNDNPVVTTGGISVAVDTNLQEQVNLKLSTNGSAYYLTNFPVNVVQTNIITLIAAPKSYAVTITNTSPVTFTNIWNPTNKIGSVTFTSTGMVTHLYSFPPDQDCTFRFVMSATGFPTMIWPSGAIWLTNGNFSSSAGMIGSSNMVVVTHDPFSYIIMCTTNPLGTWGTP